jgi:hypothetical protein
MLGVLHAFELICEVSVAGYFLNFANKVAVPNNDLFSILTLVFFSFQVQVGDLGEALHSLISRHVRDDKVLNQDVDKVSLVDIGQRDPTQKGLKGLKAGSLQGSVDVAARHHSLVEHLLAEGVDLLEILDIGLFQLFCLLLGDAVLAEVEYLLRKELEDVECVFTLVLALASVVADVSDEGLPRVVPLLFDDGHQARVELGQVVGLLGL